MNILVVAEIHAGSLRGATRSTISFARKAAELSSGRFSILAIGGPGTRSVATEELTKYGAEKVLICENAALGDYLAETYARTVAQAGSGFDVVCATASSYGKDLIPRAAALLDASYAGDCSDVALTDGKLTYKRPMFAGNTFAHVTLSTPVQAVTVRQSEFAAAEATGGASPTQDVALAPFGAAASRIEFVGLDTVKNDRPELTEADVVVAGGRALKEHFFTVLEPLADHLGAAIGASRAACDAGYAPGDFQVGQTGKVVAPKLYIAIGISGAIQHVAGMKNSRVIVAINKDADAPIFQLADYGLVADLFEAVPAMVDLLKARA